MAEAEPPPLRGATDPVGPPSFGPPGGPPFPAEPPFGGRPRPFRHRWLGVIVIGVLCAVLAVLVLLFLVAPARLGYPTGASGFGPFGGVFLVIFVLILVLFAVRVALVAVRVGRYRGGGRYGPGAEHRPLMVARMRYARGEITREQYEQLVQDLSRRPGPP